MQKTDVDNQPYQYYWNQHENKGKLIQFSDNTIDFSINIISFKDGEVGVFDFIMPKKVKCQEVLGEENVFETPSTSLY